MDIWNLRTGKIEGNVTIKSKEFVVDFYYKNGKLLVVSSNQVDLKLTLRGFAIDENVIVLFKK
jgi:hypothetical protein